MWLFWNVPNRKPSAPPCSQAQALWIERINGVQL
jgi:hypothetical protein